MAGKLVPGMVRWIAASMLTGTLALSAPWEAGASGGGTAGAAAHGAQDEAQERFRTAREHYSAGRYRAAIAELEKAHELDPEGAELVYNLGLIHEKLGDIDDAVRYYRRYVEMIDDAEEKERIGVILRRLEGARAEVVVPAASSAPEPVAAPPAAEPPRRKGRMDGWVVGTGALAGVALVAGGYFGYKAWSDRVDDPPTTGPSLSIEQLQDRSETAHREAVLADIGFGVALAAGVTSAILYFARDAEDGAPDRAVSDTARFRPAVVVVPGGAAAQLGIGF